MAKKKEKKQDPEPRDESQDSGPEEKETPKSQKWLKVNGEDKDPLEFCAWINSQVTKAPVVKEHHGKWKELLEWKEGNQFSEWDGTLVKPVNLKVRKKQVIINFMKPLVEVIEGKLNFSYSIVGNPNSSENKDIVGSQVATKMLAYNDYVVSMDGLMEEMKEDLISLGIGVIKVPWDKSWNGVMAPKLAEGGVDEKKQVKEPGECVPRCVSIFNVRPDPTAKSPNQARWVTELIELNRDDMLSLYPSAESYLLELDAGQNKKAEGRNKNLQEEDPDEPTYLIKEFWEKSGEDYPKGRLVVTCEDRILHQGPNPSPKGLLPYFFFYYKKNKYTFWSKGCLHHVQGIQREFNRTTSIISEHIEAWKPKMMVGKGALARQNSMTMDEFELVEVDFSRGEPRPMAMPELSVQVGAYQNFLLSSKDMVSNIHEISYSRLPQYASRAPASLYAQMVEQEDNKLAPMVKAINATLIEMAKFRLMMMHDHYDRPRLVKIMGENRKATVAWFDKTDLAENFDVRLETGVSVNQSQAVQARVMLEMFDKGLFDKTDRNRIIRALHFGSAENDFLTDLADSAKAMRENQKFIDGSGWEKVKVYLHDDHVLHMQYHTNVMKSEEAEEWDQDRFGALDQHIIDHYTLHQGVQAAEALGNAAKGGQPATPQNPAAQAATGTGEATGAQAPTGNQPGPPPGAEAIQGGTPMPGT